MLRDMILKQENNKNDNDVFTTFFLIIFFDNVTVLLICLFETKFQLNGCKKIIKKLLKKHLF